MTLTDQNKTPFTFGTLKKTKQLKRTKTLAMIDHSHTITLYTFVEVYETEKEKKKNLVVQ